MTAIPGFTAEESLRKSSNYLSIDQFEAARSTAIVASMTPQECYRRDSRCTQFCGRVQDPDWRHECFMRCNIYLDNCLSRGIWTDRSAALNSVRWGSLR
jgi:hypothetical protein